MPRTLDRYLMNTVKGELQGCRANKLLDFGCFKQHMHSLEKEVPLRLRGDFCINNSLSLGFSINPTQVWGRQRQTDRMGMPTQQEGTMPDCTQPLCLNKHRQPLVRSPLILSPWGFKNKNEAVLMHRWWENSSGYKSRWCTVRSNADIVFSLLFPNELLYSK